MVRYDSGLEAHSCTRPAHELIGPDPCLPCLENSAGVQFVPYPVFTGYARTLARRASLPTPSYVPRPALPPCKRYRWQIHTRYDPFGNATVLNNAYATIGTTFGNDSYNWIYGFQGGRYAVSSGLYHFGARMYNPVTGTWMQQDPDGDVDGSNLYQVDEGRPESGTDPSGHALIPASAGSINPVKPAQEITTRATATDFGAFGSGPFAAPPLSRHRRSISRTTL